MAARLALLAPRLIALVVIWLLAAASWTLAAQSPEPPPVPAATGAEESEQPAVLVVPDVRRQAYVFAKGILQDAGFAWRVEGSVDGHAANTVVSQTPAPGLRVIDNGAPVVVLTLKRNSSYEERGIPENASPYEGTPIVLLKDWRAEQKAKAAAAETEPPAETEPAPPATTTAPPTTTTAPAPPAEPEPEPDDSAYRKPDFVVEGAPREPADELPLPERARRLEQRLAGAKRPGRRAVNDWLYQHSWIVTGARFGWQDGDEALEILIRVDKSLQRRFGFGARSAAVARNALAYVESRKG